MNTFFELLRSIFESIPYNEDLMKCLAAVFDNCEGQFSEHAYYGDIFLWFLGVNTLFIINYYFGYFNRAPFNTKKTFFINILLSCIVLYIISYSISSNVFSSFPKECTGNNKSFETYDFLFFGLVSAIWSFVYCILLTAFFKFLFHFKPELSKNRNVPF